jgi:hypothetical protein
MAQFGEKRGKVICSFYGAEMAAFTVGDPKTQTGVAFVLWYPGFHAAGPLAVHVMNVALAVTHDLDVRVVYEIGTSTFVSLTVYHP